MSTNYAGIDYSGYGSMVNRDPETGIRYGVISQHSIPPENLDDVEYNYGTPDEFECPHCSKQNHFTGKQWGDDTTCDICGQDFEIELPDCRDPLGWGYSKDGYELSDALTSDIFISKSPYYTYAQFCSPCVPGAGNLDNPFKASQSPEDENYHKEAEKSEFPKTFCLSHDWFEDNKAPYPVFDVLTGKEVLPKG